MPRNDDVACLKREDCPDLKPLYLGFSDVPLVSISNDPRRPIANASFVGTVVCAEN
jgi:hypothetical protein